MSRLCGWLGRVEGHGPAQALADRMAAACFGERAAKAVTRVGSVSAVSVLDGDVCQKGETLAAICGHVEFADARFAAIAQRDGMAAALIDAYAELKSAVPKILRGDFSLAIIDERRLEAVLAIDRMGVHSVNYAAPGSCLVFGSVADAVVCHPAVNTPIDRQGVYDYVYFHMVPGPETIFRGQRRLAAGHALTYSSGRTESVPYWEMRFEEATVRPFAALKAEFVQCVRDAVRVSAGTRNVGAFLSGGTDSSTIAGLLGQVTGEPARTFSIGFEAEGYDEMEYARIAATHFKTRHHEYYVTPADVVDAIPRIASAYDQPFGNSSAVPTYYCAKLARSHGIDRLLGGDGGDELFGGNERYAIQHLFSLYGRIPEALRRFVIEPIVRAVPAGERITLVRRTRGYIRQASIPMPARLETYNMVEQFGAERIFTAEFLGGVDRARPLALLDEVYRNAHAGSMINRMLALDRKFTLADNDLRKVTRVCELAQVDVAFPLLDDAVVEFSTRLEPSLKLRRGRLRYFFKEALRDFLPPQIITKSKHGFGLPFGLWLKGHEPLRDLVYGSLADLKKREIVRADFIDELASVRLAEHASYYGSMIWVLMMLEQWFQQHRVSV